MRLLLDTAVFIWATSDEAKLSSRARRSITNPRNERYLSVASAWEIAIQAQIGRLQIQLPLERYLSDELERLRVSVLDVRLPHALGVFSLPTHHDDPFDRLLVAQAIHERLKLVSSDEAFDEYPVDRVW